MPRPETLISRLIHRGLSHPRTVLSHAPPRFQATPPGCSRRKPPECCDLKIPRFCRWRNMVCS